jgi:hypothetical protein
VACAQSRVELASSCNHNPELDAVHGRAAETKAPIGTPRPERDENGAWPDAERRIEILNSADKIF